MRHSTHGKKKAIQRDRAAAYGMLAPFLLFFVLFVLYPLLKNLYYSFTNYNLGNKTKWIGLSNYRELFTDYWFLESLRNTAVYALFSVIFLTVLGLFISVLLNQRSRLVKIARTAMIIPYATSMVAVSMIWLYLLDPTTGYVSKLLVALGVGSPPLWLDDPSLALPSLIGINIWKNLGYCMIIYLAGLQGIPPELYEAATVDGAGFLQKHWKITLPQIAPVTFFVFVNNCIEAFKTFEQVQIMTQGGPVTATTTVVYQIYVRAFNDFRMGYAAAMSVVLFVIIFAVTMLNFRMFRSSADGKD
ncbi:MAG: sugar ABC transporter permease [Clostridiales bacterium]|nr:sugar ABC transporter permease [Clostridiales bacterium]MDD7309449.1 sugar ABC transporter permease [Eubacteriales bacterium]MDY5346580.1 sugar ABC transporter permease [Eubacteriales bacterium]